MSALLGGCGPTLQGWTVARASRLLLEHSWRGRERVEGWETPPDGERQALLLCARDGWECSLDHAGPALLGGHGPSFAGGSGSEIQVVCDATLWYRDHLLQRLSEAGVTPRSEAASDLVAAAWRAFGPDCVHHLEGDWAFLLLDQGQGTFFAARDPFGARSLFHRQVGDALFLASTPHPLAALTDHPPPFDPEGILRAIWQQEGDGTRTGWLGIQELAAGTFLHFRGEGDGPEIQRFWLPRADPGWRSLPGDQAPETLARLLARSSRERVPAGGAAVAMSGGQDSTAVVGLLAEGEEGGAVAGPVHIVSLAYPEGDPGNEDPYVNLVAEHVGKPVHWVPTEGQELLGYEGTRAHQRSLPAGHAFETQNRALARQARALGVRVLMNGHGGDNLLWVSDWYMADLLRRGRWLAFRRAFRARGYGFRRHFLHYGLRPALPLRLYDTIGRWRGRPIRARPHGRALPPWLTPDPTLMQGIEAADRAHHDRWFEAPYRSVTDRKRAWGLGFAAFPRVCAALFDLVRDEGVELRMPFYDPRLSAFALARPPEEFNQPGQAKVLLRRAMRGRLPDGVVDPRPQGHKTGTAEKYFRERFDREAPERLAQLLGAREAPLSHTLGLVDPGRLAQALQETSAEGRRWDVPLLGTLHAEEWLQAQVARGLHF